MPHFTDQLAAAVAAKKSPLVVGIDPRWEQLPESLRGEDSLAGRAEAYRRFAIGVIEAVAEAVPAVKPQMAFFEELGPAGMAALKDVIDRAHGHRLLVVLDGKRNDIGSTAQAYANGLLGRGSAWGADALTVSPYLGDDSLTPFAEVARERGAGVYVLVKTSNPGGAVWQDRPLQETSGGGSPLYRYVGDHVESLAKMTRGECGYGLVGAVVGATYPEQLAELRAAMPHTWLLVPGYGAQGGSAAGVAPAFDAAGMGAIVNSSRAVIFAHARPEYARFGGARWQEAVHQAAADATAELTAAAGL
ncbi:MAG: orotidine-5'-phosphate decarboxylase [Planctomycetota bacterium]